jgi:hypothetical protein
VPIGVRLEFAADGEQRVLGERDAYHLEATGMFSANPQGSTRARG